MSGALITDERETSRSSGQPSKVPFSTVTEQCKLPQLQAYLRGLANILRDTEFSKQYSVTLEEVKEQIGWRNIETGETTLLPGGPEIGLYLSTKSPSNGRANQPVIWSLARCSEGAERVAEEFEAETEDPTSLQALRDRLIATEAEYPGPWKSRGVGFPINQLRHNGEGLNKVGGAS